MHTQEQHRRWENNHIVNTQPMHCSARQDDVAMHIRLRNFFALTRLVRNPSANILIAKAKITVKSIRRRTDSLGMVHFSLITNDRIFNKRRNFRPAYGLNVMRIYVNDEPICVSFSFSILSRLCKVISSISSCINFLNRMFSRRSN